MTRWGIVGTGGVSALFVEAVAASDGGKVVAVASREPTRAKSFGDQYDIEHRGDSLVLAMNHDVEAVYIATPPALHHIDTLRYLHAGKQVLCEKPLAVSEVEAAEMAEVARGKRLFLMEAMWCRFLPAYSYLRRLLDERYVGDVVSMEASFGIKQPNRNRNEFNAELGGGALLTGGVYPVQLAHFVLGAPESVQASGKIGESGVDESFAALLSYPNGVTAAVSSSIVTDLSCAARINGIEGTIVLPSVHSPSAIGTETFDTPVHRLLPEVDHVHECLAAGLTESPIMPLAESVAIAGTMDKIRARL